MVWQSSITKDQNNSHQFSFVSVYNKKPLLNFLLKTFLYLPLWRYDDDDIRKGETSRNATMSLCLYILYQREIKLLKLVMQNHVFILSSFKSFAHLYVSFKSYTNILWFNPIILATTRTSLFFRFFFVCLFFCRA